MAGKTSLRNWLLALLPLALLAVLLAAILAMEPERLLTRGAPPVEELVFEQVRLDPAGITATVVNDGPDPVRIAQVMVDEAYWRFEQEPAGALTHLQRGKVHVPYPWVEGEVHVVTLLSSTGVKFEHEIAVAIETPRPSGRFWGLFALIGTYVGVLPVAVGLLWYPLMRRLGRRGLDFVLAATVGLLVFLFVDAAGDGLEAAGGIASSYHGAVLFVLAAALAYLAIEMVGRRLAGETGDRILISRSSTEERSDRGEEMSILSPVSPAGWSTALLVAVGIGLHNLGEGLAIGAAYALGEATLGTLLIFGFAIHNTTEGLAIVAPLADERTPLARLALLGLIAGVPTIFGAWLGGFLYAGVWGVLFLALGAGAIAQVVVQILRGMAKQRPIGSLLASAPVVCGLAAGFAVMYLTGLIVG